MKIELKNVTKEFDKVEIIKNISLEFETGKIYGLYGRNKLTQNMIAKRLGISRSYVSRIEKKAISKLHREFEKKDKNVWIILMKLISKTDKLISVHYVTK